MEFDGSSTTRKGREGLGGEEVRLSFKLNFSCSNNEDEYEVLVLGLLEALRRGI